MAPLIRTSFALRSMHLQPGLLRLYGTMKNSSMPMGAESAGTPENTPNAVEKTEGLDTQSNTAQKGMAAKRNFEKGGEQRDELSAHSQKENLRKEHPNAPQMIGMEDQVGGVERK